jgi:magnesium-transporting ATPase (P-type)
MTAVSTCTSPSCGTKVEGQVERCPKCNRKMRTPRTIRRLGISLVIVGLLLAGGVGYLYAAMTPMLSHPGVAQDGTTFSGTAEQARMVFTLFQAIIAFGLASIVNGVFQIVTGRRSTIMLIITLIAFAGIVYLTYTTNAAF